MTKKDVHKHAIWQNPYSHNKHTQLLCEELRHAGARTLTDIYMHPVHARSQWLTTN